MAYVVTFLQVDPLFCVDLSDPRDPKVLGELKIPGFSSYLHPLGDGLMIGFGRNVLETFIEKPDGSREVVGTIDYGAKISLFDLNDPFNPLEIDVMNLERNSWSMAFNNPRAIMVDRERRIFGFAFENWSMMDNEGRYGVRLIGVQGRRLVDLATLREDANSGGYDGKYYYYPGDSRLCYIGNTLYTITGGTVTAYDYTTFARLAQLTFVK
jgi:uncharacterized secreted protein with C-terminal beta-propeller domain